MAKNRNPARGGSRDGAVDLSIASSRQPTGNAKKRQPKRHPFEWAGKPQPAQPTAFQIGKRWIDRERVIWTFTFNDGRWVEVNTKVLFSHQLFAREVWLMTGIVLAPIKPKLWRKMVNDALAYLREGASAATIVNLREPTTAVTWEWQTGELDVQVRVDPQPGDCLCLLWAARGMARGILEGHISPVEIPRWRAMVDDCIALAVGPNRFVTVEIITLERPRWLP